MKLRRRPWASTLLILSLLGIAWAPDEALARDTEVPINAGVGPALLFFGNPSSSPIGLDGPLISEQPFHYALRLRLAARIDYDWVMKNRRAVPRQYRRQMTPETVVYIRPAAMIAIPRDIILSPPIHSDTQIYGGTWEPFGLGFPLLSERVRWSVGAGLILTYAYIDSEQIESPTHFLRPGVSLGTEVRVELTEMLALSAGLDSNLYLPQALGSGPAEQASPDAYSLWHIGEAFLQLHVIFPYQISL